MSLGMDGGAGSLAKEEGGEMGPGRFVKVF
jgi:hypothetical protein